ncbi:MAG: cation-translocating P-type ATPase [Planctomycetes bacterium]|nr:cation-translocating P-type ATPase [Planctomycetota bacterium]
MYQRAEEPPNTMPTNTAGPSQPILATASYDVPALDCPQELQLIEAGLGSLAGISALRPDYVQRRLHVDFDPATLLPATLEGRLNAIGFPARPVTHDKQLHVLPSVPRRYDTLAAAALLTAAIALWLASGPAWLGTLLVAASLLVGSYSVARAAWRALRLRRVDINVLMIVAAIGGVAIGDYFEVATAMVLFGVSLWLEAASVARARGAIESLVQLTPRVAHCISSQGTTDVPVEGLEIGDRLLVRPGERVPADGAVVSGASTVNEAALTGESLPRDVAIGADVWAGSLNGDGAIELRVARRADDSTLAHMARLVDSARVGRARSVQLVDRLAGWYTPAVVALAAVSFVVLPFTAQVAWTESLHRALVLLVASCPCALVISTPVTMVCGLHAAARQGILIKGGEHLERAAAIDVMAFDKTGTLTRGEVRLVDLFAADGHKPEDVLRIAASLEQQSEHPLARAIVAAALADHLTLAPVEGFHAERGAGVRGIVDGRAFIICGAGGGTLNSTHGDWQSHPLWQQALADRQATLAALIGPDGLWGVLLLADTVRPHAAETLEHLRRLGVQRFAILSGDRSAVVNELAAELGIDEARGGLLPADKLAAIKELEQHGATVALVGDGVNDAPALAAASLGIAFGAAASDTALETADVVILKPDLHRLGRLIAIARECRARLRENVALALGSKLLVLGLAAVGAATLWMAVAADVGATLAVVFNGMRLLPPVRRRETRR